VLRITISSSGKKVVLKLEGSLAGPWVEELRKTVLQSDAWRQRLEVDVSGLTSAEEDGDTALIWLRNMGARFLGKGPFPEYLFERLNIPLFNQKTRNNLPKSFAEPCTTETAQRKRRKKLVTTESPG